MNVFNSERNVIITANKEINSSDLQIFLENNLNKFRTGSRFFMMAGLHHENGDEGVQIGESDSDLIAQFNSSMERIINKCEKPCEDNCSKCKVCDELHAQVCHEEDIKCNDEDPCHRKCSKCEKCQELHSDNCTMKFSLAFAAKIDHIFVSYFTINNLPIQKVKKSKLLMQTLVLIMVLSKSHNQNFRFGNLLFL